MVDAYVSRTTPVGNVAEVTFVDNTGRTVKVTKEKCKTVFYSTLFGETKSVKSMRFTITGGSGGKQFFVNSSGKTVPGLKGLFTISGRGTVAGYNGESTYVITSSGVSALEEKTPVSNAGSITITGTGSGHNVGMSQYGAKAMAEMGYSFNDILQFYFTGINLERVGFGY